MSKEVETIEKSFVNPSELRARIICMLLGSEPLDLRALSHINNRPVCEEMKDRPYALIAQPLLYKSCSEKIVREK